MPDQQALPITVERVAKRSTSRVVRLPHDHETGVWAKFTLDVLEALRRAGVKPGESFYVARVPPRDRTSHLGDLTATPRGEQRRRILQAFARFGPMTASYAEGMAGVSGGWRRVSELVQGGHLEPTGETVESTPGHPARLLRITDRGRAALRATDEHA